MKITWMASHGGQIYDVPYSEGQTVDTSDWDWRQKHNAIAGGMIVPKTVKGAYYLDDLADVDTAGESAGSVLGFDGTSWVPQPAPAAPFNPSPIDDPANWASVMSSFNNEFTRDNVSSLPTGWSWVNQNGSLYTERYGFGSVHKPGATGDDNTLLVKDYSALVAAHPSHSVTLKHRVATLDSNYAGAGLVIRDSTTGHFITFYGPKNGHKIELSYWNSPTLFSSTVGSDPVFSDPLYLQVRRSLDPRHSWWYSNDGVSWVLYRDITITGFVANPDQIGYVVFRNGTGNDVAAAMEWLRV